MIGMMALRKESLETHGHEIVHIDAKAHLFLPQYLHEIRGATRPFMTQIIGKDYLMPYLFVILIHHD